MICVLLARLLGCSLYVRLTSSKTIRTLARPCVVRGMGFDLSLKTISNKSRYRSCIKLTERQMQEKNSHDVLSLKKEKRKYTPGYAITIDTLSALYRNTFHVYIFLKTLMQIT